MIRFPPRKILVPMDLSASSQVAWRQARELAHQFKAKLEVIYVQPWVHAVLGLGTAEPMATAEASERALEELKRRVGGEAEVITATGVPDEQITSSAQRRGVDLIVMGTHGRTGFDRAILGSVAEAVIRRTEVPVLVVRDFVPRFNSVLAPVHAEPYAWEGLMDAGKAAEALGAKLTVLHVFDSPVYGGVMGFEGTRSLLQAMISKLPAPVVLHAKPQVQLAFGNPAEEIVEEGNRHSLVALVAHRKGFLKERILGGTAERVLRHLSAALLALPERAPKPAEIARIFRFPTSARGARTHEPASRTAAARTERVARLHHPRLRGTGPIGASRRGRRAPGRDVEPHDLSESDRGRRGVRRRGPRAARGRA